MEYQFKREILQLCECAIKEYLKRTQSLMIRMICDFKEMFEALAISSYTETHLPLFNPALRY